MIVRRYAFDSSYNLLQMEKWFHDNGRFPDIAWVELAVYYTWHTEIFLTVPIHDPYFDMTLQRRVEVFNGKG